MYQPNEGGKEIVRKLMEYQGFPLAVYTWGGGRICPPPYGGASAGGQSVDGGDKALMGGTHEGGHRPYGGGDDLTLIDYIIN